ncbi:hypothetical protein HYV44_03730 [Candidatus Microgenomates bacterium]|nr:hypothetical protein [Candidatus Microgenomates bacterium]
MRKSFEPKQEKPKGFWNDFLDEKVNKQIFQKISQRIKKNAPSLDDTYTNGLIDVIFEEEKAFCKSVTENVERRFKNLKIKDQYLLWDVWGTLGVPKDKKIIFRESIVPLLCFIRLQFPRLKMGILSDVNQEYLKMISDSLNLLCDGKILAFDYENVFSVAPNNVGATFSRIGLDRKKIKRDSPLDNKLKVTKELDKKGRALVIDDLDYGQEKNNLGIQISSLLWREDKLNWPIENKELVSPHNHYNQKE